MADNIQTMIPRYGELNRIYRDYIDNRVFSFDRQKFISDFCQEYNDMKSFEAAILELVLDRQKEQYTLILNSLKTEIEKSIQAYETHPISDSAVERACYQHMERYSLEIEAQQDVTRSLSKPLNEANNRYDSIGYREHTAEEEKQAEKEYERCKAEYDKERAKLNELYDQQKAARKEAFQYMKNRCEDMYRQSCLFLDILKKYIPDGKRQDEPSKPISQQETADEQQEYFSMKLLSLIHEVCVGEQFDEISAPEFLSKEDLEILHENIECFAYGQSDLYKPIRSKVDNSLRSIDLMHFVWNIGERLDISLIDRATFIHTIFPHELKDASIKYLAKNLRTCGVCKIALDIPKTGDYHFKITKFCTV